MYLCEKNLKVRGQGLPSIFISVADVLHISDN